LAASAQTDDFVNGLVTQIDGSAGKITIRVTTACRPFGSPARCHQAAAMMPGIAARTCVVLVH
jgi:hypothetical protein